MPLLCQTEKHLQCSAKSIASFARQGRMVWNIGHSTYHYYCHKVYFPDTMACDVLKVDFFSQKTPSSISYRLPKQTAADMIHSLNITKHASTQCLNFGYSIMNVVTEVAELMSWAIQKDTLASALIVAPNAITPLALRAAPNTVPPSEGSFILNPINITH